MNGIPSQYDSFTVRNSHLSHPPCPFLLIIINFMSCILAALLDFVDNIRSYLMEPNASKRGNQGTVFK